MCCESTTPLDLPAAVIEMIARYHALLDARGWIGGDDRVEMFRWARFSALGDVFAAFADTPRDWPAAVRAVIGEATPSGVVVVSLTDEGLRSRSGPPRLVIAGSTVPVDVVIDSAVDHERRVDIGGHQVLLAGRGAAVHTLDVDGSAPAFTVAADGATLDVSDAVRVVAAGRLHLRSERCARWSVLDASGTAWFPTDQLAKWDVHARPFFHAGDVELDVPAGPLAVACTRGLEFERVELDVVVERESTTEVTCNPARLYDPNADGWYGADLHIHMNYSGDLVCKPEDAARMQLGEGLQVANFVAGNCQTSLVYDRETLESTVGEDLPWSTEELVARMGVEYRNDLLGHVHAFGPTGVPTRYATGHERSDHPEDWPPNAAVCEEFRRLHATVGYPHPVSAAFPENWSTDPFFANPRSVEAELVIDAALGLVDSIDVISPFDDEGAVFLYHRLLSCGLRLAATAGTDTFLSFSHGPGVASNPPGWGRVYAELDGERLSVTSFQAAIRAGRTVVTNGPWVTFEVDGRGPGTVLDVDPGERLVARASVIGGGTDQLALVGPDGVVATGRDHVEADLEVDHGTWMAAVARGPGTANTLDTAALAHTSPVYVDVNGRRVARGADAHWCLGLIDRVEELVAADGAFERHARDERVGGFSALFEEARAYYRQISEETQ